MNNPPAFPQQFHGTSEPSLSGLTMRDYFAAKAMQGYCSDPDWRQDMTPTDTAFAAYTQADAMLKARTE
jgi:hypothetical protein